MLMRSVNRQLLPGNNDAYVTIPGRDGSLLFASGHGNRVISINCTIKGNSPEDLQAKARDAAAWLHTKDYAILSFDDETGLYYKAKVASQIDFENITKTLGTFDINFNCEPFAYGGEESKIFVGDSATVNNQGSAEAQPRFMATFLSTAGEWKVTNQDGYYIRIAHDFVAGDTLEVNCRTGAIFINGARAMDKLDWQNSRFFNLRRYENTLTVTPTSRCNTTVYWTSRWL